MRCPTTTVDEQGRVIDPDTGAIVTDKEVLTPIMNTSAQANGDYKPNRRRTTEVKSMNPLEKAWAVLKARPRVIMKKKVGGCLLKEAVFQQNISYRQNGEAGETR